MGIILMPLDRIGAILMSLDGSRTAAIGRISRMGVLQLPLDGGWQAAIGRIARMAVLQLPLKHKHKQPSAEAGLVACERQSLSGS